LKNKDMIELHQMLHGYKLGHNYVQGSILLPSSHDMDKIATLSDWSEFVDKGEDRDYITAYPLLESPYYVIAKSWYADRFNNNSWSSVLSISFNMQTGCGDNMVAYNSDTLASVKHSRPWFTTGSCQSIEWTKTIA